MCNTKVIENCQVIDFENMTEDRTRRNKIGRKRNAERKANGFWNVKECRIVKNRNKQITVDIRILVLTCKQWNDNFFLWHKPIKKEADSRIQRRRRRTVILIVESTAGEILLFLLKPNKHLTSSCAESEIGQ